MPYGDLKMLMIKILNLKLVIMLEYQILFDGHMLLMISMARKLLEYFMKKNCKKINKDLGQKKSLKENNINYMSNEKDMIIHLIAGLIKKLN